MQQVSFRRPEAAGHRAVGEEDVKTRCPMTEVWQVEHYSQLELLLSCRRKGPWRKQAPQPKVYRGESLHLSEALEERDTQCLPSSLDHKAKVTDP